MKRLFSSWLIALLLLLTSGLQAQESPIAPWLGEWKGTLEIYNTEGLSQTVAMELNVAVLTDSTWRWQIVYGEDKFRAERNYELVKTETPGQYIVDEKNGIELYLSLLNNGLHSFFQVNDSNLIISYKIEGDQLIFNTLSANTKTGKNSGGGENTPTVISWQTGVYQQAVLKKNE